MGQVFISYSRADKEVVPHIVSILKNAGHEIWFDESLSPGSELQYLQDIQVALNNSEVVLVCWSKKSIESKFVLAEALHGFENDKLVQVIIEEEVYLPVPFNGMEYINVFTLDDIIIHGGGVALGIEKGKDNEIERIYSAVREVIFRGNTTPIKKRYNNLIDLLVHSLAVELESKNEIVFGLEKSKKSSVDVAQKWEPHQFAQNRSEIRGMLDGLLVTIPSFEEEYLYALLKDCEKGNTSAEKMVFHCRQSLKDIEEIALKIAAAASESSKKFDKIL